MMFFKKKEKKEDVKRNYELRISFETQAYELILNSENLDSLKKILEDIQIALKSKENFYYFNNGFYRLDKIIYIILRD